MTTSLDELCPMTVGAAAFDISLADPDATIETFVAVELAVSFSRCEPEDPTLPLELIVVGPSAESFVRKVFRRILPESFFFVPIEGGKHTILLREVTHNLWRGTLVVDVEGDELPPT